MLAAVPVFFGIVFRLTLGSAGGPGGGPPFLNQLAGNGVFLALVVLTFTLSLLLLPLSIAVVAGDSIAGEAGLGTLRGLLTVPSGRTRLLAVKYAAIVVFSLAACLVVAVMSLIMGLILFHAGQVTLLSGTTVSLWSGVLRVLLVAVYAAVAMMSLGAIGLAASTLTQHPVGAIAGLLVITVASEICDQISQLSAIHPYLPTHFWLAWDGLFRSPGGLLRGGARPGGVRGVRGDLRDDRLGEAQLRLTSPADSGRAAGAGGPARALSTGSARPGRDRASGAIACRGGFRTAGD